MEAIAVLFAALLHATWNGLLKGSDNQTRSLVLNRAVAVVLGAVLIVFLPPLDARALPYLLLASLIHQIYFFSLLGAYRQGDFSQVYPISRGLAPVIILAIGFGLGIDSLTASQVLGVLFVSFGIMMLAGKGLRANSKPIGFALLTALCIAGYTLASGLGVRQSHSFLVYAAYLELTSGGLFIAVAMLTRYREMSLGSITFKSARLDILSGVMAIAGFAVALWAMTRIPIATVSALRETSVIFAALIAWYFLKERQAKHRILASVMVFIGVAIILA